MWDRCLILCPWPRIAILDSKIVSQELGRETQPSSGGRARGATTSSIPVPSMCYTPPQVNQTTGCSSVPICPWQWFGFLCYIFVVRFCWAGAIASGTRYTLRVTTFWAAFRPPAWTLFTFGALSSSSVPMCSVAMVRVPLLYFCGSLSVDGCYRQ